jgi:alkyl hydroperoxide reductase subunit AhpC
MATLYLDHVNRSLPTLRQWLDGKWGLLLSHPTDFEDHSLERDRWLEILREEFRASGVKPIACRCADGEPDRGWASTLTEDEQRVRLTHGEVIDIPARRLRDELVEIPTPRFVVVADVVVVDPSLLCHIVLMYQRGMRRIAVSPLDLLGSISNLRRQSARQEMGHLPRRAA